MANRPTVTPEQAADAPTLADSLNTQVLTPLYARIEALEKRAVVRVSKTTGATPANLFPFVLPTPPFPVRSVQLTNAWDETNNAAPTTIGACISRIRPDGKIEISFLNLAASTVYTLEFTLHG